MSVAWVLAESIADAVRVGSGRDYTSIAKIGAVVEVVDPQP